MGQNLFKLQDRKNAWLVLGMTEWMKQTVGNSIAVDVKDGNVTMEAGQFNEYTMLNWMSIEPAN